MLYAKLAWRNILRNKRRSGITAAMIGVAVAVMVFFWAFAAGAHNQMIIFSTDMLPGQIQLHATGYHNKPTVGKTVPDPEAAREALENTKHVAAFTERVKFYGLISKPDASSGAMFYGIDPETEGKVTFFQNRVVEGEPLAKGDKNGVVLAKGVAENLDLSLGDKVVLMSQAADGTIAAGAFRVRGIISMGMPELDNSFAAITSERAKELLVLDAPHEFAVKVDHLSNAPGVESALESALGDDYEVLGWQEMMPQIEKAIELDWAGLYVYVLIILIVAASGITNTILMSVMERTREFGLMRAMGAKRRKVAFMVLVEAVLLTLVGIVGGLAVGTAVTLILERTGMDFSKWADVFEYYGIPPLMYPDVSLKTFAQMYGATALVIVASILASLWPAIRTARLSPARAMRHL